jgi:hypothetical protein
MNMKTTPISANLLREQLIKIFNLATDVSDPDIAAAAAAAQEFNVTQKAKIAHQEAEEELIAQKMKVGLSRDQATAVIQRQKTHDAAIARQWAARRPAIVAILKKNLPDRKMRARVRELDAVITLDEINAAKESLQRA